ncbi:hypothetical protein IW967_05700 [Alicyclobacillus mali]|uniref:Uncharacterized protein n=1 Tax=Alicyclobacillus mali (ex Roth et al. 2021) TaxID=1123961 RepID=A0ABS0F259_9BACL|nr:hypothetical protein [Alicyclobacillus mali (ex Roth et al. 2021)]MBF8377366.1 hypothetical protein [Alicyclobacillus mali (ex Roth et al. 2021)]MCL6487668.1 hypothetical protein [Alicyclobacillus mali (ex Roth et al. 2021)]
MVASLVTGIVLVLVALSYHAGRRAGFHSGRQVGRAEAPLLLRMRYQLDARCPICDDSGGSTDEEGERERCGT